MDAHRTPFFLRRKQVEARTGLSRSTIYEYVANGDFPRPVQIGRRAVGWLSDEVDGWLQMRIAESRKVQTELVEPVAKAVEIADAADAT